MIDLKCSSQVARVEAATVADFKHFFSWAVVRTTGMTASKPLGMVWPGGGMTMPVGVMQSSSTGTGSLTSQSSSSIKRGRPISREVILSDQSVFLSHDAARQAYLSQLYTLHQTRLRISVSKGGYGPLSVCNPMSCDILTAAPSHTHPGDRRFTSIK